MNCFSLSLTLLSFALCLFSHYIDNQTNELRKENQLSYTFFIFTSQIYATAKRYPKSAVGDESVKKATLQNVSFLADRQSHKERTPDMLVRMRCKVEFCKKERVVLATKTRVRF